MLQNVSRGTLDGFLPLSDIPFDMTHYMLDGKNIITTTDTLTWAEWYGTTDRIVKKTMLVTEDALVEVSTVFLGLDHGFGRGVPVLFETMIFGGKHDMWQERYHTWDEAEAGHEEAVAMVREQESKDK